MTHIKYELATTTWDQSEILAIKEVLESGNFTMGENVKRFEDAFAEYIGSKYAVMVNSGSSANLLLIAALRYQKNSLLSPGDEIIVPAVSWSTTYYPVQQLGFILKFVDIDINTLNLDFSKLADAVTPKTKAIFAVNLLGNPCNFMELESFCIERGLLLLEDNCESLGAEFEDRKTGSIGLGGTHSFFFSHHICTMEGGMITTNSMELFETMISLRAHGWVRGLPKNNSVSNLSDNEWENKFRFVLPGYNLRPLEIEAAAGLVQLKKLPRFLEVRRKNAAYFLEKFSNFDDVQIQDEVGSSSWFGFSFILLGRLAGKRDSLLSLLNETGIESRPIVAGNFLRNPVVDLLPHVIHGEILVANQVHDDGLFVGNSHLDLTFQIDLLHSTFQKFLREI
jgi:CDP-6-deoxy-D-xylo-4-hexulose-3-dehydrase